MLLYKYIFQPRGYCSHLNPFSSILLGRKILTVTLLLALQNTRKQQFNDDPFSSQTVITLKEVLQNANTTRPTEKRKKVIKYFYCDYVLMIVWRKHQGRKSEKDFLDSPTINPTLDEMEHFVS